MIDAFIKVSQFFGNSLGLLWRFLLGAGSVGALVIASLLFKRLCRLVGRLINVRKGGK